jgi:hypothetical protein
LKSVIILFSLTAILVFYSQVGMGDFTAPINASLEPYRFYYITMSEKLSEGILFTNESGSEENVQYPLLSGSTNNNAIWNYNISGEKTEYWIFFYGNVEIDLCHGAENHLCSKPNCIGADNVKLDISNAKWSSSLTNNENYPSVSDESSFVIGFDNSHKVSTNLSSDTSVYLRYFLDIPSNVSALAYNTTYQIRAVLSGENCA